MPNSASVYGLNDVRGYDAIFPAENYRMLATIDRQPSYEFAPGVPYENITLLDNPGSPVMDLLGVRYVLSTSGTLTSPSDDLFGDYPAAIKQSSQENGISRTPAPLTIAGESKTAIFAHPSSTIQFPSMKPITPTFSISFGIDPRAWTQNTDGVQFQVLIGTGSGAPVVALDRTLDPAHHSEDRNWMTETIDFSAYMGKTITLVLATNPGPANNVAYDWAYWAEPHFAHPSLQGHYTRVFEGKGGTVFRNNHSLPRAFLIGNAVITPSDEAAFQVVSGEHFDPGAAVVLTQPLPAEYAGIGRATEPGNANITRYNLNDVTVEYAAVRQSMLVLSDAYAAGWSARIDGKPVTLYRAYYNLRAIVVPGGKHTVTYTYRPKEFTIGAAISGTTALGTSAILLVPPFVSLGRKRRNPSTCSSPNT